MDVLGSVVFIATVYGWKVWDRRGKSDWLRVDALWTVVAIATGYVWTARET